MKIAVQGETYEGKDNRTALTLMTAIVSMG